MALNLNIVNIVFLFLPFFVLIIPMIKLRQYENLIAAISVFLITISILFSLPINLNLKYLVIFMTYVIIYMEIKKPRVKIRKNKKIIWAIFLGLLTLNYLIYLLKSKLADVITILGLGYDHWGHFTLFSAISKCETQLLWCRLEEVNYVKSIMLTYAPGTTNIWSSINTIFLIKDPNIYSLVAYYTFNYVFHLIIFFLAVFFYLFKLRSKLKYLMIISSIVILVHGQFSNFLVSGFPPYIVAFTLFLFQLILLQSYFSSLRFLAILMLSSQISFTSPAFLPVSIFVFTIYCLTNRINIKNSFQRLKPVYKIGTIIFIFITLVYTYYFSIMVKSYGAKQILAPGGIEPIATFYLLLFISAVILITYSKKKKKFDFKLDLVYFIYVLYVLVLYLITFYYTGTVQYYALKQAYFIIPLSIFVIGSSLRKMEKISFPYNKITDLMSITLLILVFFSPSNKTFTSGYMGRPAEVIEIFSNGLQNEQIIYGPQVLRASNLMAELEGKCGIYTSNFYEWDLNSRWINALSGTSNDYTFALTWGIGLDSQNSIESRYHEMTNNYDTEYACIVFNEQVEYNPSLKQFFKSKNWRIKDLRRS